MKPLLAFACLLGLPACFLSSHRGDECGPSPCFGVEVASCDGIAGCEPIEWCGETIYCDFETPCTRPVCAAGESASYVPCEGESDCRTVRGCGDEVYCRPLCDGPRPVCADSIEVESCEGWATCFAAEWCGGTILCASDGCVDPGPTCAPGETASPVSCRPDELDCTPVTSCGVEYGCRPFVDCADPIFEPCTEATSTLISSGPGMCPDGDSYTPCYESFYCGAPTYCVTACPQGAEQVAGPQNCERSYDCYSVDHGRDDLPLFWCQGNGPACRAIPTCEGEEIPLDAPCPTDAACEYQTLCSTTVQCVEWLLVPG